MKFRIAKVICFFAIGLLSKDANAQTIKERTIVVQPASDPGQRFSLCLPENYDSSKTYPLIIFLDPSARGDLPVSLYHSLADKYDVILAGSWNSKNFDPESSSSSVESIYNNTVGTYSIDTSQVFLAGFSGGARAASDMAVANNYFSGVIACGAGFDPEKISTRKNLLYAGIAGNKDMNFSELLDISMYLDKTGNKNVFIEFDGEHVWPPYDYVERAFAWLIQEKLNSENISLLKDKWISGIRALIDSDLLYAASISCQQFGKFRAFRQASDSIDQLLQHNKAFKGDKKKFEESLREEAAYTVAFSTGFIKTQTFNQIDSIRISDWYNKLEWIKAMKKSKNKYVQLAGIRCLDKSMRNCSENSYFLLSTHDFIHAYNLAKVMSFFYPYRGSAFLLMARAAAGLGDKKLSEKNLKQASRNGMASERIMHDELLQKIFTAEELMTIAGNNQ
jgi:predicted esterase